MKDIEEINKIGKEEEGFDIEIDDDGNEIPVESVPPSEAVTIEEDPSGNHTYIGVVELDKQRAAHHVRRFTVTIDITKDFEILTFSGGRGGYPTTYILDKMYRLFWYQDEPVYMLLYGRRGRNKMKRQMVTLYRPLKNFAIPPGRE